MACEFMGWGYRVNDSKRRAAWTAHYIAKGCNSTKAENLARDRCERRSTWPPVQG